MTFESVEELLEFFSDKKVENLAIEATVDAKAPEEPKQREEPPKATKKARRRKKAAKVEGEGLQCTKCDVELTDGNWYASMRARNWRVCKTCHKEQVQAARDKRKKREKQTAEKPKKRELAKNAKRHRKAKEETKAETQAVPEKKVKTRPVGDLFKGAYDYMSALVNDDDKAAESEVLELIGATDAEMEMAREVVLKLMRAAVAHSPTDFQIAAGKKSGRSENILLRLSAASLPSLDLLRAY